LVGGLEFSSWSQRIRARSSLMPLQCSTSLFNFVGFPESWQSAAVIVIIKYVQITAARPNVTCVRVENLRMKKDPVSVPCQIAIECGI
jgi:hypothetical protein